MLSSKKLPQREV